MVSISTVSRGFGYKFIFVFGVCVLLTASAHSQGNTKTHEVSISYNREIRPILSNHCFACHGPDDKTREAGLRLDRRDEVDFAEVVAKIMADDQSEIMPPPHFNKPLTAKQIALLKKWIAQGAVYERHWAFEMPQKASVPKNTHPIDFFIDNELRENNLKRSPRAKAEILIRRVYLDLIGLPPSLELVEKFVRDPSDSAYQKIVDELLASPRYGERWARRWLDLARYADTNGYEKDRDRSIWPYRDWVIATINRGQAFDQFTIEQLAGDMLPNPTQDQIIATGFHRNTMLNEEGGIDPLEFRYYSLVDRVATTGTTWMGLTLGCAQCHSHKYDPITHEEYFGVLAYFNNADEPDYYLHNREITRRKKSAIQKAGELLKQLESRWPQRDKKYQGKDCSTAFQDWLKKESRNLTPWQVIRPEKMKSNLPHLSLEKDGVIFVQGDTTKHDTYQLRFPPRDKPTTSIRLEVLPDPRLPGGGPGMTFYEGRKGDFFLSEIRIKTAEGKLLKWTKATETFAKNQFGNHRVAAELATDGDVQTGWSVASGQGSRHVAVFNLKQPLAAGKSFTIEMEFGRHFSSSLGKFRLSASHSDREIEASVLNDEEANWLSKSNLSEFAKSPFHNKLKQRFLLHAPQVKKHADQIRKLLLPVSGQFSLVMQERRYPQKRKNYLYKRGEYTQPQREVTQTLPAAIFSDKSKLPMSRLEFAKWLVSRENPLTARVVVNRQWAAFFGNGIVKTLDDFGMQGAPPTHPELLDYLAVDLMERKWSIKEIHRLIVTSETYQQQSALPKKSSKLSSLLGVFPRRRLEAEIIRDSALSASGLLELKMYGPPVRPPQPTGVAANFSRSRWQASRGADRFRRSIYTYQKRTAPFAMFTTFDATSGESCVAQRNVSNTPLQALTLMNDPMFMEIAEAMGKRMQKVSGNVQLKIETGFRWLLARKPTADEKKLLNQFHATHKNWTALARVLLCLDETITNN